MTFTRRIGSLVFACLLATSVHGQSDVVADTLDWHEYYPLEVGNAWEWTTRLLVDYRGIDRREIVSDTIMHGQHYFVQQEYSQATDNTTGEHFSRIDTTFLRYENARARIVARSAIDEEEWDYTCDLSADFGTIATCPRSGDAYVGGGYASDGAQLQVGTSGVPFNALKSFITLGGGNDFFHGVGKLPGLGDGTQGSIEFNYANIGGMEYGQRVVHVGIHHRQPLAQARVELYPNPARDRILIRIPELSGRTSVTIHDVLGRSVLEAATVNCVLETCEVSAGRLAPGIYIARLTSADGYDSSRQFVILR